MAFVLFDRVREYSDTNGTGAIHVTGVVSGGYQTFDSVLSNGDTTLVCCRNAAGQWQTFLATWDSATQTLARTTPYEGSDGEGVNVGFSGESQEVWINYPAEKYERPSFRNLHVSPTYATNSGVRLATIYGDQSLSAGSYTVFRLGGITRGTISGNVQGVYSFLFDEDRLRFSDTSEGALLVYNGATLRAGWSGGRTLAMDQLYVGNPSAPGTGSEGTSGEGAYHVAGASFAYSYTNAGGAPGAERGNLFGRNDAVRVLTGSGPHWNSAFGHEIDVGVEAEQMALWKGGLKVVQWSTDRVRGLIQDYAFGINNQAHTSTPGWRHGFALGGFEGYWPFRTDSTIMGKINANGGAGNSPVAGAGINLRDITFGESAFASDGFRVDGSGNLGALTASGVALQTRSGINAKTAVVNTITVIDRGLFISPVTLTLTAPTTSGTTATATVATYTMEAAGGITTGGIDYAVGDTITVSGGTSSVAATGVVTHITDTGGVVGLRITNAGTNSYSALPSNPVSTTTSGAGTGFTFTPLTGVLTVTVSGAGTNYSEHLPPTVSSSGSTTYRQAVFAVTMTATAATLALNHGADITATGRILASTSSDIPTLEGLRSTYTAAWFHNNVTYAGAMAPRFSVTGALAGTITGSNFAVNDFTASGDNVNASSAGGLSLLYSSMTVGGSVLRGNRTAVTGKVFMTTASPNQDEFKFLTGGSFGASMSAKAGGVGNGYDEMRGYVFGALLQAKTETGGLFARQMVGLEINPDATYELLDHHGLQVVVENAYPGFGIRSSAAYGLVNQTSATHPGWDFGYSFLLNNGIHALHATRGTVLGAADNQYTTGPTAAYGVDLVSLTLSQAGCRGPAGTAVIDGSGNIGGQIVAGTTLQTRSSIVAKTCAVNTITVIDGSLFLTKPTLTVAAPPGGGTQATASINTMAAALAKALAGGTGYAVNDTVTLSGGTSTIAAVFTVAEVSSGVPTRLTLTTAGSYTVLPSSPVSTTTSGSGTGLTVTPWWTALTVTVSAGGDSYPEYPPPLVTAAKTTSGSDISPLRRPMFQVAMTATATTLQLNNGKINVTGIPTSSAGLSAGDVYSNAGVLTVV